jgi:hypothetical protein
MDWSGAVCPNCGSSRVKAYEVDGYEPDVLYAQCQDCPEGWDVRVTAEGVVAAPVIYHGPGSGWDGPPHGHRESEPCVLCDLAADAGDLDPGGW